MKQDNKLWSVVEQFFMGLGFALAGALVTFLIIYLCAALREKQAGLLGAL